MQPAAHSTRTPHGVLPLYYHSPAERRPFVDQLFNQGAPHYERIVRWMSFGTGELYRRDALVRAGLRPGMTMLDVATGTGVLARGALDVIGPSGAVFGLDPSPGMLHEARNIPGLRRVQAFAESLPVASQSLDFLSMGYALRHVEDLVATFREYHRVLRPGGRVVILELVRPRNPLYRALARLYLKRLVPWLASLGSGTKGARTMMEYFWDTIDACVPGEAIVNALTEAGFTDVKRVLMAGVMAEYQARKV